MNRGRSVNVAICANACCGLGLPGPSRLRLAAGSRPPNTYDLVAPRSFSPAPKAGILAVRGLRADGDATRWRPIVSWCGRSSDQVSYYKGIAWSDRLPRLVQARIIETFQNSGAVKVGERHIGQYALVTDLRAFQIDVSSGKAFAEIEIFAKLINISSGKVVATKGFSARVPATTDSADRCDRRAEPGLHRGAARYHYLGRLPPRLVSDN